VRASLPASIHTDLGFIKHTVSPPTKHGTSPHRKLSSLPTPQPNVMRKKRRMPRKQPEGITDWRLMRGSAAAPLRYQFSIKSYTYDHDRDHTPRNGSRRPDYADASPEQALKTGFYSFVAVLQKIAEVDRNETGKGSAIERRTQTLHDGDGSEKCSGYRAREVFTCWPPCPTAPTRSTVSPAGLSSRQTMPRHSPNGAASARHKAQRRHPRRNWLEFG
jgi:hypothetical protein